MIGNTGNRPRTSTHHISHGAGSPHPAATIHSSTAAARLAAGTADASPITFSARSSSRSFSTERTCCERRGLPTVHARPDERASEELPVDEQRGAERILYVRGRVVGEAKDD